MQIKPQKNIFRKSEQEKVDIESISNKKELENRPEIWDENTLSQGISDLDVPGSDRVRRCARTNR
jgi:hypothetical protein